MRAYDKWYDYAVDVGIPDDQIEDVVANAEICPRAGCINEGSCAENTKALIDRAADRIQQEWEANVTSMKSLYDAEVKYGIYVPMGGK